MIRIAIALLLLLAVPANAQDRSAPGAGSIFHDTAASREAPAPTLTG